MRDYSLLVIVCTIVVFACSGCNKNSFPLAKVSGRITKAGVPVAGASIFFQPMASSGSVNVGPGSTGITNEQGYYELRTFKDKAEGAVIGKHRITIHLPLPAGGTDDGAVDASLLSPIHFRDGSTQIEVPATGIRTVNFDLNGASKRNQ